MLIGAIGEARNGLQIVKNGDGLKSLKMAILTLKLSTLYYHNFVNSEQILLIKGSFDS